MLKGTKKIFPTKYDNFVQAMINEAENDELPTRFAIEDIDRFTFKDFEELFSDFANDTGLEMSGTFFRCDTCGKLHLMLDIDFPEEEEETFLQ